MSDITVLDDFDESITHAFTAKMVLFISSFLLPMVLCLFGTGCCATWGHNCSSVLSLLPIRHEKKHHGWHIFDIVHLFCLWTMHFKEGKDASVAKCVPNKWYPSQTGSSLESVLAKGSKSMGLRQHPNNIRAGAHSRASDRRPQLTWQLKGPLTVSQQAPQGTSSTSRAPKWGKMGTK